jgi:signal recognition particle subunit SRP54
MAPFEGLSNRLQGIFQKLRGKGKLSEDDVSEALREVRLALLEADVNFKVVKEFITKVKEQAVGQVLEKGFNPAMTVIQIVNQQLTELMGGTNHKLSRSSRPPTVIMMVGLQGAGKTTTSAKLAKLLKQQNHRPILVAADVYRPAAIKQLQILGEQTSIPVFTVENEKNPVLIASSAIAHAKTYNNDYVIIDTAGRLHVDQTLMDELHQIKELTNPDEILLVVDAMTGQDAVNVAEQFNSLLELSGVVLTKLDGDTRGGAAISVKAVTGKPIKFAAVGEKLDALEPFHPERMASRILGMGDMLSLIEKAQANLDESKAKDMERKLRKAEFTLEDFLDQMQQLKKMGPLENILEMLPGMGNMKQLKDAKIDNKQLVRVEAIIMSMTRQEKQKPEIINASRRKRIAAGSGTTVTDVNRLLKQFEDMKKMMKQFSGMMGGKGNKSMANFMKNKGRKFPF